MTFEFTIEINWKGDSDCEYAAGNYKIRDLSE